jgi:hypothetical protein
MPRRSSPSNSLLGLASSFVRIARRIPASKCPTRQYPPHHLPMDGHPHYRRLEVSLQIPSRHESQTRHIRQSHPQDQQRRWRTLGIPRAGYSTTPLSIQSLFHPLQQCISTHLQEALVNERHNKTRNRRLQLSTVRIHPSQNSTRNYLRRNTARKEQWPWKSTPTPPRHRLRKSKTGRLCSNLSYLFLHSHTCSPHEPQIHSAKAKS